LWVVEGGYSSWEGFEESAWKMTIPSSDGLVNGNGGLASLDVPELQVEMRVERKKAFEHCFPCD